MQVENQSTEFVTVARFLDPAEAQMARGALEAAGIAVFLQGENANNLVPMAFRARLQVAPADEIAARELLRSAGEELPVGTDERIL